jgi:hypothetical protein
MASTINASSTGSGGLISTGDASGTLELQANGTTKLAVASTGVSITGGIASPLEVTGNSTAGAEIRLPEDTDNGSNYVALKAADNIASNVTFTLPSADGTSGQVLQTNGSGTLSFATPASGALVLLSTVTASNSATVDVETTFDSTYDVYIIQATGVTTASGNVGLRSRLKIGGSYLSAGDPYSYAADHTGQADTSYQITRSTADNAIEVVSSGDIGNASTEYTSFVMRLDQVASTALYKVVTWVGMSLDTGGVYINQRGGGRVSNAGALTGVRFLATSGNIAAGSFRLYGYKNS